MNQIKIETSFETSRDAIDVYRGANLRLRRGKISVYWRFFAPPRISIFLSSHSFFKLHGDSEVFARRAKLLSRWRWDTRDTGETSGFGDAFPPPTCGENKREDMTRGRKNAEGIFLAKRPGYKRLFPIYTLPFLIRIQLVSIALVFNLNFARRPNKESYRCLLRDGELEPRKY